ncbi:MAG: carbohydrate ABC transporter permease, partial [Chloroflexota bacterium]|nr:carbohydrate ABC transporter permease [Chloroflexota bacterium]
MNKQQIAPYLLRYTIILLALIFFLFPIFWIGTMAVKSPEEYFRSPPVWWPQALNLSHFAQLVRNRTINAFGNSVIVAGTSTLLALLVACPAAYSLARFNTGGQNLAFWILSQRFLPPIAVIFPIFLLFRTVRLIDT